MKVVISDTSALSALFRLDQLAILPKLYGKVIIPPAVFAELMKLESLGFQTTPLQQASWLSVLAPARRDMVEELMHTLDAGEAEAITLAREQQADLLIIDEMQGRKVAAEMNLPVIGLLGVLLEAKQKGHVPALKPLMQSLKSIGFFISPSLYTLVLQQVGEAN